MDDILSQIIAYAPDRIDTETKARAMVLGPRNMYAGGQLVQPNVDGSRPGYSGLPDGITKTPAGNYKAVASRSGKFLNLTKKSLEEAKTILAKFKKDNPFKTIKGNNPCSILKLNSIDLKSLGFLLAIYEHKVFTEASILGIDPFDQWGVQLGKKIASEAKNSKEFLKVNFSKSLHPKS